MFESDMRLRVARTHHQGPWAKIQTIILLGVEANV